MPVARFHVNLHFQGDLSSRDTAGHAAPHATDAQPHRAHGRGWMTAKTSSATAAFGGSGGLRPEAVESGHALQFQ